MIDELSEKLEALVVPILAESGIDLIEFNLGHAKKTLAIQILADKPRGGIVIDECISLNKKIGKVLDEQDWLRQDYTIEVSSPGLDRPLRTKKDFFRVLNREVRVHLTAPFVDKVEYAGVLKGVSEEHITLAKQAGDVVIPLEQIHQGKQVI